jgi:hypothetical protein
MKKIFPLELPNKAPARVVDSIKSDIRKYLKRERHKTLPEGVDFWDFDCKVGLNPERATVLHAAELNAALDHALNDKWQAIYVEIVAKPGIRMRKPTPADQDI